MEYGSIKNKLPLILGGCTLILFIATPSVLDFIEPAKSIGDVVVDTAKDFVSGLNNGDITESDLPKRELWSNILLFLSWTFLLAALASSVESIFDSKRICYGLGGALLAAIGFSVYLLHLTVGTVLFVIIVVLVLIVVAIFTN